MSGASLRLVCDSVDTRAWTIGCVDLGGVTLQVAEEGGGNLCVGGNTHEGRMLFVPLTRATEHVVNGKPLDENSLFSIPRGAEFRRSLRRRAHDWCSITLSADVLTLHGVWEFGRFASRYRRHFGESPSTTLRRTRAGDARAPDAP